MNYTKPCCQYLSEGCAMYDNIFNLKTRGNFPLFRQQFCQPVSVANLVSHQQIVTPSLRHIFTRQLQNSNNKRHGLAVSRTLKLNMFLLSRISALHRPYDTLTCIDMVCRTGLILLDNCSCFYLTIGIDLMSLYQ